MNPIEHGEVFVTDDGLETDQDLGHYERFTGLTLNKSSYLTNGQVYNWFWTKSVHWSMAVTVLSLITTFLRNY